MICKWVSGILEIAPTNRSIKQNDEDINVSVFIQLQLIMIQFCIEKRMRKIFSALADKPDVQIDIIILRSSVWVIVDLHVMQHPVAR